MSQPYRAKPRNKVLIITYYWPPSGGPGVQRVLKFAKYLPDFGWEPIVLTVKDGDYPAEDESLKNEGISDITVIKISEFSVLKWYKRIFRIKGGIPTHVLSGSKDDSIFQRIAKWIRINLFLPDARYFWSWAISSYGPKIVREYEPDLILSSSPPHSLQLGALKLAKKTGLKWIVDFRDPWTDGFWLKDVGRSVVADKLDKRMEQKVLNQCDALITVSPSIKGLLLAKGINDKCSIVYNGYDSDDFNGIPDIHNDDAYRIVYTGSLRKSQIPHNFLKAISRFILEHDTITVKLEFFGSIHPEILALCEEYNISKNVVYHGYVDHREVIAQMCSADLLLLLIPDKPQNEGILTGKIFEYLGSGNSILGIGPTSGDAAMILNKVDRCDFYEYDQDIYDQLTQIINSSIGSKRIKNTPPAEYARRNQTGELARIFNQLIG